MTARHLSILPAMLLTFWVAAPTGAQDSVPWGLEQLMQQRTQVSGARAEFTEVRKVPTFDLTTTSSGVLIYQAPDRLERQTLTPQAQNMVVQGERITLEVETATGERKRREFALDEIPGLRPLFRALRNTLAGDLVTLQRQFEVSFSGAENDWRLKLVPRAAADRQVREILFSGRATEILAIEVNQKNGDSSRMVLSPQPAESPAPAGAPSSGTNSGS